MRKYLAVILSMMLLLTACDKNQTGPTWQEQYDLGVRYLSEGNYEEAIIAFTAAIEIDPKQAMAYVGRGDAYIGSGETEDKLAAALADYELAIEMDETNANAYLGLADVYIRQGEYEKALGVLKNAIEKTDSNQTILDKIAEIESGSITDSFGNIRRISTFDTDGNLIWYHEYNYDSEGRQSAITAFDNDGAQLHRINMAYNESGQQSVGCWGWEYETGELTQGIYAYDSEGRISRVDLCEPGGAITQYVLFEYGEGGDDKESTYDADGTLIGYSEYDYEAGHLVEYRDYDENNQLYYRGVREFDDNGKEVRQDSFDGEGTLIGRIVYVRDEFGKLIQEEHYDENGNITYSQSYK